MSAMCALVVGAILVPPLAVNMPEAPRTWDEWLLYPVEKVGHLALLPWGPEMGSMSFAPKLCGWYVYKEDELAEINRNRRRARWVGTAIVMAVVVGWWAWRRRARAQTARPPVQEEALTAHTASRGSPH